ncbi:MAG: riboflavin biosynthesis protein RibD [Coxiella sp. (in: Bacteria)]|nr:MAG: riboflavin biosynthesis protein RibD [Coxiella sp. (in: g-proteobacteria)]
MRIIDPMRRALELAEVWQGRCAPNPAVGAVVVRDGKIIAEGAHQGPGLPHAEVMALNHVESTDADELYVTLEPCCHQGRTPPCTDLIIDRGIKRVFFAYLDPNPEVAGRGQRRLIDAGIDCQQAPMAAVDLFYQPYKHWWHHKMPTVTLKLAITDAHSFAIDPLTGPECQRYTHQQRLQHDALLTTATTIAHDNPQMNGRLVDNTIKKPLYILDSTLRTPKTARVFDTCDPVTLLQASNDLELKQCLKRIAEDGYHTLWIESGWKSASAFIRAGLVDKLIFYVASAQVNTNTQPFDFVYELGGPRDISIDRLGEDLLIQLE